MTIVLSRVLGKVERETHPYFQRCIVQTRTQLKQSH